MSINCHMRRSWSSTCDLGIKPLNVVMKATHVRDTVTGEQADTVKLSDDRGKHTGPIAQVLRYQGIFGEVQ